MNLNVLVMKPFRLVLPSLLNSNEMSFNKFSVPTGLRMICNTKKKKFTLLFVMISIGVVMLFTYRKGRGTPEIIARQGNGKFSSNVRNIDSGRFRNEIIVSLQ